VAELEAALGVRLLQRSTRQVALTDAGQTFFATCERVLGDLKDAEDAMSGEYRVPKGGLTVTAPAGFGRLHLQPVAMDFLAAYPQINLRLMLIDRVIDLVDEQVDIALRISELADSAMIARPLGAVRMVVTASPLYLARHGTPSHPAQLASHDCIAWSTLGPLNTWWFRSGNADQTYPVRTRLATSSAESAIDAAQAGLGLAQTTCYQAERHVRAGDLVIVLREFECGPTPVNLLYASSRLLPLKLRAFVDFAAPRLSARLREVAATMATAM
jgi:DNA-binding transcriptional LysR family regulator